MRGQKWRAGKSLRWGGSCALGLTVLLLALFSHCSPTQPEYAAHHPATEYVGMASCQSCHQKIYQDYLQTGMGKSLYMPKKSEAIERFGPGEVVWDQGKDFGYWAFWENESLYIEEFRLQGTDTVFSRKESVDYIVGSGHQTRSYLLERNGYLYEHPITWYVNKEIWDLSPGYDQNNSRFSREIGQECLSCHTGHIDPIPQSKNRYRKISLGIDCEKCHGPGAVHVARMQAGEGVDVEEEIDYSIVNPAKLSIQAQFDVCQQCHLQGVNVYQPDKEVLDFRPGQRLRETFEVFLERRGDPDAFGIASHAERLQESRCFQQSAGKLNCTSCHNPHKSVTLNTIDDHIRQCLRCHSAQEQLLCAAPEAVQMTQQGDCVACHMPKGGTSDIPHVSFHDHNIRVVQSTDSMQDLQAVADFLELHCATSEETDPMTQGSAWLRFFETQEANPRHLERAGKLLQGSTGYPAARVAFYQGNHEQALALIDAALQQSPESPAEWSFLKGEILEAQGAFDQALQQYDALYQANPENSEAGVQAVVCLLKSRAGDPAVLPEAEERLQVLLQQRPFDERILSNLGFVCLNQGKMEAAWGHLSAALRLAPDHAPSLESIITLHLLKQEKEVASSYFQRLKLRHPNHPALSRLARAL
ncbi:MAG: tetratricopeptide repeat protein [Bacteroidota bacterium]